MGGPRTNRQRSAAFCRKHASPACPEFVGAPSVLLVELRSSKRATVGAITRSATEVLVARWYDAVTGQFMSADPAVQSTNAPYSYAASDPIDLADPSGQLTCSSQAQCNSLISSNYQGLKQNAAIGEAYLRQWVSHADAAGIIREPNCRIESGSRMCWWNRPLSSHVLQRLQYSHVLLLLLRASTVGLFPGSGDVPLGR